MSPIHSSQSARTTTLLLSILSLITLTTAYLSQGCTHPQKSPIDWRPKANDSRIFQVGSDPNSPREIRVRIPSSYNGSSIMLPLILAYHDKDMSTAEMEYQTRLSDPHSNNDFIVVYPTAKNDTWQSDISVRRWQKKKAEKQNITDDVAFTKQLLNDLETVICFNTERVHATGLGTGAGLLHLLACDAELSNRISSFAAVAGGYGHRSTGPQWKECLPGRKPVPILSIHGDEDRVLPYLLNEWEAAKSRLAVPTWLEEWSERNGCGEPVGDAMEATDATGTEVKVTRLDGGGWISEGEAFGGGAWRTARSCPSKKKAQSLEELDLPVGVKMNDSETDVLMGTDESIEEDSKLGEQILTSDPADFTILHYRVRNYGHGWPTLRISGSKKSEVQERFFDATALVLDWFKIHELPTVAPIQEPDINEDVGEDDDDDDEEEDDVKLDEGEGGTEDKGRKDDTKSTTRGLTEDNGGGEETAGEETVRKRDEL